MTDSQGKEKAVARAFLGACNDIDPDSLHVIHAGYEIELSREDESDAWYIQVRITEEGFLYDGWWRNSEYKSIDEAMLEAVTGAQIDIDEIQDKAKTRINDPAKK